MLNPREISINSTNLITVMIIMNLYNISDHYDNSDESRNSIPFLNWSKFQRSRASLNIVEVEDNYVRIKLCFMGRFI